MTVNEARMVALCARFLNAVDVANENWAVAAEMDAAFDAGEFSGPACWRAFEADCDRLARRFGFGSAAVAYTVAEMLGVRVSPAWMGHETPASMGLL